MLQRCVLDMLHGYAMAAFLRLFSGCIGDAMVMFWRRLISDVLFLFWSRDGDVWAMFS